MPKVSGFAATSATETSVTCTWTAVTTDEDISYKVYRNDVNGGSQTSATLPKDRTSHEFTGLSAGQEYDFSIAVTLDSHEGMRSEITYNTSK